jgi:rhamnogalacturonyl hydrolase YesR
VKHHPLDWTNGALYRGLTEWGKVSGNETCYNFVRTIGEKYHWTLGPRVYHADDICVGQAYIEMYRKLGELSILQPVIERAYYIATHPSKAPLQKTDPVGTNERWSWCDALFMAPPVYAALFTLTGDTIYLNYLNREYRACVDSLYDKQEMLFYRDNKRIPVREKNGAKQFWGRGNGWVFAGLPLIIDNLPVGSPDRNYYIELFTRLASSVRKTQCKDGSWRTSLLDPDSYNMPENSCSGFFCYGLAWGIRKGYLPQRAYRTTLKRGWESLVRSVHSDGKLGYIQPVGAAPKAAGIDATDVYGVGAFLLAGSELYKAE